MFGLPGLWRWNDIKGWWTGILHCLNSMVAAYSVLISNYCCLHIDKCPEKILVTQQVNSWSWIPAVVVCKCCTNNQMFEIKMAGDSGTEATNLILGSKNLVCWLLLIKFHFLPFKTVFYGMLGFVPRWAVHKQWWKVLSWSLEAGSLHTSALSYVTASIDYTVLLFGSSWRLLKPLKHLYTMEILHLYCNKILCILSDIVKCNLATLRLFSLVLFVSTEMIHTCANEIGFSGWNVFPFELCYLCHLVFLSWLLVHELNHL